MVQRLFLPQLKQNLGYNFNVTFVANQAQLAKTLSQIYKKKCKRKIIDYWYEIEEKICRIFDQMSGCKVHFKLKPIIVIKIVKGLYFI